jgi:hypothetical protein
MPLTAFQFPYTGPYGLPGSGLKSKGPTAESLKRAMSRMGLLAWDDFDQHYNQKLADALERWDPGKSGYGTGRWEKIRAARIPTGLVHAGEYALDQYARWLVQDEAEQHYESTAEQRVQECISTFGYTIIRNAANIGYRQFRPVPVNVDPAGHYSSDCSATVIQAFAYAKRKTGIDVPDPAKQRFSGYGNTDYYEDDWPKVGSPYRVGDLAHFRSSRHVIFCIKAGSVETAEWCSHGREASPELVKLYSYVRFPEEFMFVVRPRLVA